MMGQSTLELKQELKQLFRQWTIKHHDLVSSPKDLPPSKELDHDFERLGEEKESIALLKSL
jgi:hypothetical protein